MKGDGTPPFPSLPGSEGGAVFAAPWEAQAFAMTLALFEVGLFTWPEWTSRLADQIRRGHRAGDRDLGDTYYHHWLAALERIVAEKGAVDPAALERTRQAWKRATDRTPHGSAIVLEERDFA
jgi:nitrile hydratase accessory protein